MTDIFTNNASKDKFNYVLDYNNYIDKGKTDVGHALAKTRNISGLQFDQNQRPIGGEQTTFFIPRNEPQFSNQSKILNDVGRALVILHEGIHADINAHESASTGLYANHHEDYTEGMYKGIVQGLLEFNSANKLGLSNEQINIIAWNGLQGTEAFNAEFDINPNDSETAQKKLDDINNKINKIIYNDTCDEKDKNKNNIKN